MEQIQDICTAYGASKKIYEKGNIHDIEVGATDRHSHRREKTFQRNNTTI